jgi:hypothetical protein
LAGKSVSAEKRQIAKYWMRVEPNLDWGDVLERSRWHAVLDSKESLADSMLKTTAFVSLTERKKDDKPFLVRAVGSHVGTAGFEVHVRKNGDFIIEDRL